ncbi:MAG: pantetheine-phosphate adenylyltransferase [Spartobacteria bacterium]
MKQTCAIYPGSFDPVHLGHIDVIMRSTQIFSSVIVAVAASRAKGPLFGVEVRMQMLRDTLGDNPAIEIAPLHGLLVDFAREREVFTVIRGLRAVSDFEFEFQMALMNRKLEPRLETIYLTPKEDYTYLSSRIVKEVALFGGDVERFVPAPAAARLKQALAEPGIAEQARLRQKS